jgi:hypothetical protein
MLCIREETEELYETVEGRWWHCGGLVEGLKPFIANHYKSLFSSGAGQEVLRVVERRVTPDMMNASPLKTFTGKRFPVYPEAMVKGRFINTF